MELTPQEEDKLIASLKQDKDYAWQNVRILERARQEQDKKLETLQAKLDAVMLEYCPEDMTQEQVDNWARHQRPVSKAEMKEIEAALNKDKEL